MWTPKRVVLLTGGIFLFVCGYVVYTYFLGGIDGLPFLPEKYLPGTIEPPPIADYKRLTDRKLAQAFGDDCKELQRSFKIEATLRGLVLAFDEYKIEKDGRVKLTPFSLAIFKDKGEGSYPEINTLRCQEAYLRFDQPIKELTEIGSHRIIGAELRGGSSDAVTAVNNRRTPQKSDDVQVDITRAPVFFDDKEGRIWTDGFVQLLDMQTQPEPTRVVAKGMDLHLTKEAAPAGKPSPASTRHAAKGNSTNVSGVDKIVLRSNVDMHLWVDSTSGFLSSGQDKKEAKAAPRKDGKAAVAERARVTVKTVGTFTYDLPRDLAIFEGAPPGDLKKEDFAVPPQVHVYREHVQNGQLYDHLVCGHLELQFRKKPAAAATPDTAGSDREIESARATARPGEEVNLVMDTENIDAHGSEFIYYSATATTGPQTILRGTPMWALKDAHLITARELHLVGADTKGEGQHAVAQGPGQIDLLDRKDGTNAVHQYHALWKDTLVVTKDREGEHVYDLLTFTGEASFIDDEHHQEMRGDKLQVWLEPPPREEPAGSSDQKQPAAGAPRQRPHKVEAFDHVAVRSPDLNVHDSEHLIVRFKDGAAAELPALLPPESGPTAAKTARPGGASPTRVGARIAATPNAEKKADAPRPINLWARRVAAYVLRRGSKSELQEVVTEGNVHVHQEGAKAEDKGVDIKGETLNLVRRAEGDVLVVFGDARGPAQLQLGDLYLAGPKVSIDQKRNVAEVEGSGAMRLPSKTGLDGGPTKKAGAYLTVHWNKDMYFDGKDADFRGGIVAYEEEGSLKCQTMQVTLDRTVSLKEGQKGGQAAKVNALVCDRQVYVANITRDDKGQFVRYERLMAMQLTTDNREGGSTVATGPQGSAYIFQLGQPESAQGPGARPAAAPKQAKQEYYLTRVDFQGRMFTQANKAKIRHTTFLDNVDVYYLPADNPDVSINKDKMPKGSLYLKCEKLAIDSRPLAGGTTGQYMTAEKNVSFRSQEFYGQAPVVKYDQPKEVVDFLGVVGNPVVLFRNMGPGREFQRMTGLRIRYFRKTGEFQVEKGGEIVQ